MRSLIVSITVSLAAAALGAQGTAGGRPTTNPMPTTGDGVATITGTAQHNGKSLPPESRPPAQSRPSARFSLLFLQYLHADAEAAIDALAKWEEGEVIAEAVSAPNDDVKARQALVAFLTETGIRKGTFGQFSDYSPKNILLRDWGLDKNFEIFSFRAFTLIKDLTRVARSKHDQVLARFCGRWYATTASYSLRVRSYALQSLRDIADHDLSEVPEVRLLVGSLVEPRIGPFWPTAAQTGNLCMLMGPDGYVWKRAANHPACPIPTPTQETLYLLHHAVESDDSLAEAHLRLGRVLHMINENAEAIPHLELALRLAQEQHLEYLVYMAGLYLGDVDGHAERWTDAVAHLRLSVAAAPTAHIANIALGEALLKSGDRAGWDEARRMFDDEDQTHPKKLDPWFYYRFAQYWRVAADLREMRRVVRAAK